MNNGMVKLTGLWKNTKDGKTYLSGSLGTARVLVFPNEFKKESTDPDFNLVLAPKEEKTAPAAEPQDLF